MTEEPTIIPQNLHLYPAVDGPQSPGPSAAGRVGPWTQTISGVKFYPFDPQPQEVRLFDIAWSLAHICRFAGNVIRHYSVAEHSIYAATQPKGLLADVRLCLLLHDAAEAYTSDIPAPIKVKFAGFPDVEDRLLDCIHQSLTGINWRVHRGIVKDIDRKMLLTEQRDLVGPQVDDWGVPGEPFEEPIGTTFSGRAGTAEFIVRYFSLMEQFTKAVIAMPQ